MAGGELQAALEATPGGGAMTLVVEHRPQIAMRIREGGLDSQGPAIGLRSLVVGLRIRVEGAASLEPVQCAALRRRTR